MADEAEQRATMVHALREEPGSYARELDDGSEVVYEIRPLDGGFVASWSYATDQGPGLSHEEEFRTHADALKYLEENFNEPLGGTERPR